MPSVSKGVPFTTTRVGTFVITLCSLAAPIEVPQPGSPELSHVRFFISRRRLNGVERFFLHMGYFSTAAEAAPWLKRVQRKYPHAFASRVAGGSPEMSTAPSSVSLTDTQVLTILERRGPVSDERIDEIGYERTAGTDISMLRPEDTDTRRALREAVVRNEPVWFAVQLHWSSRPIDLVGMQTLPIFKLYTLYSAQGENDGQRGFCARLGFFSDAISARQLAHYVRAQFASVAVIPVSPQERERAVKSAVRPEPAAPAMPAATPRPSSAPTLDKSLRNLASSEFEMGDESLSTTGVRHLRVEVMRKASPPRRSVTRARK